MHSKLKGSENVQHFYFTIVLFSLGILQAHYFSLIISRCIFCSDQNVMTLYITIVNLNGEPLKQDLFYKIHFKHLTKESCKHFNARNAKICIWWCALNESFPKNMSDS